MNANELTALDRVNSTPLYVQLKNIIRSKISSEEWLPNTMIPSENELSSIYGISRMTARNVITQLVAEGLLYRIPGKGTFVNEAKIEITGLSYTGLRSQLESQGQKVETKLLSIERVKCDEYVARKLNIAPNDEIYKIKRMRTANGIPVSYHKSFVPCALCKNLEAYDLENDQLCKILSEHFSLNRARVVETLESYIADVPKAEILGITPGFPLIMLQDTIATNSGEIFEYTRVYFRGDKIKLRLEYNEQ